jgi:hypothetical protein
VHLHKAKQVEMAKLADVGAEKLLDVNDRVGVVFSHSYSSAAFRPSDQSALGEFGHQDGLHASSISVSMESHSVVVEVQEGLCILQHLLSHVAVNLRKLDHSVLTILRLQDFTHGVWTVGRTLFHHQLHSS